MTRGFWQVGTAHRTRVFSVRNRKVEIATLSSTLRQWVLLVRGLHVQHWKPICVYQRGERPAHCRRLKLQRFQYHYRRSVDVRLDFFDRTCFITREHRVHQSAVFSANIPLRAFQRHCQPAVTFALLVQ
jgi:hypothetical protein